jgi:hypothetical protein
MPMDDPLRDRQTDSGSFILVSAVQALEHAKEFVHICHIEAHAVILDKIHGLSLFFVTTNGNHGDLTSVGKFDGIGQQIDKNLLKQDRISLTEREIINAKVNVPLSLHNAQIVERLSHQVYRRHRLLGEWLPAQAREGQEIVDQLAHVLGVVPYELEVLLRVVCQVRCVLFEEDTRKPINRAQRCP